VGRAHPTATFYLTGACPVEQLFHSAAGGLPFLPFFWKGGNLKNPVNSVNPV